MFMNAYAMAIEPHTNYLGPRSAENFDIAMRLSLDGIGAVLQSRDDYTVIREVVPGGPADKSGKLKVGDRIVGVAQGNGAVHRRAGLAHRRRGRSWCAAPARLDRAPGRAAGRRRPGRQAHDASSLVRKKISMEEQSAKKQIIEVKDGGVKRRIGVISAADLLPGLRRAPQGRQGLQERDPRRRRASWANSRRTRSTTC